MELMLIVWVVDLIVNLSKSLTGILMVVFWGGVICIIGSSFYMIEGPKGAFENIKLFWKKYLFYPKTLVTVLFLAWLIPSPKTLMFMGGAYIVQNTFENDFVQESATLAQKATINQLKIWAKDSSDLENMLKGVNINIDTVKDNALQQFNNQLESDSETKTQEN